MRANGPEPCCPNPEVPPFALGSSQRCLPPECLPLPSPVGPPARVGGPRGGRSPPPPLCGPERLGWVVATHGDGTSRGRDRMLSPWRVPGAVGQPRQSRIKAYGLCRPRPTDFPVPTDLPDPSRRCPPRRHRSAQEPLQGLPGCEGGVERGRPVRRCLAAAPDGLNQSPEPSREDPARADFSFLEK